MYALVMAGGKGRRMKKGGIKTEKPLIEICGKPIIERIIDVLNDAPSIDKVCVVVSPHVPHTIRWLADRDIEMFMGRGEGYLQDMMEAVESLKIKEPFIVCMGDLPLLNTELIELIVSEYGKHEEPALSVHVPLRLCRQLNIHPDTVLLGDLVPCGINILRGDMVRHEQDEYKFVINRVEGAVNINWPHDITIAEKLCGRKRLWIS